MFSVSKRYWIVVNFFLLVVGVLQMPSNKYSLQLIVSILLKTFPVSHRSRLSQVVKTLHIVVWTIIPVFVVADN